MVNSKVLKSLLSVPSWVLLGPRRSSENHFNITKQEKTFTKERAHLTRTKQIYLFTINKVSAYALWTTCVLLIIVEYT